MHLILNVNGVYRMELSYIRILGLVTGAAVLFFLSRRLRIHSAQRVDIWGLFLVGGGLIVVSLFPDLANVPSDIFLLNSIPGGRIIALLVVAVAFIFFITVSSRSSVASMKEQLDRFIQSTLAAEFIASHPGEINGETILILIPAFNEEESLEEIIPAIPENIEGRKVKPLIIDDGSMDNTAAAARACGAFVITHPFNRGGGAALRTGYAIAEKAGVEIIVTMDGDGQHRPGEIERLLIPILSGEADFVIGSRMLGSYDQYSSLRIVGVHVFNRIINLLMGTRITDCASGFRAIRIAALGKINLLQDQYHTSEMIIDAAKKGLRITEREIHIATRLYGYSKKGRSFVYAFGFLRTVLSTWWR